jgi:hypothetical protein
VFCFYFSLHGRGQFYGPGLTARVKEPAGSLGGREAGGGGEFFRTQFFVNEKDIMHVLGQRNGKPP